MDLYKAILFISSSASLLSNVSDISRQKAVTIYCKKAINPADLSIRMGQDDIKKYLYEAIHSVYHNPKRSAKLVNDIISEANDQIIYISEDSDTFQESILSILDDLIYNVSESQANILKEIGSYLRDEISTIDHEQLQEIRSTIEVGDDPTETLLTKSQEDITHILENQEQKFDAILQKLRKVNELNEGQLKSGLRLIKTCFSCPNCGYPTGDLYDVKQYTCPTGCGFSGVIENLRETQHDLTLIKLHELSHLQIQNALMSSKMDISYDPYRFVERQDVKGLFGDFTKSFKSKIFLILGEAGIGKTWMTSHLAYEYHRKGYPVFYITLREGIENFFQFVFSKSMGETFADIASMTEDLDQPIVWFFDGYDEVKVDEQRRLLLNNVIRWVSRTPKQLMVLTTRAFDWIDCDVQKEYLPRFKPLIWTKDSNTESIMIKTYSDNERNVAIRNYKLPKLSKWHQEIKNLANFPLWVRLLADYYQKEQDLPHTLRRSIFEDYFERMEMNRDDILYLSELSINLMKQHDLSKPIDVHTFSDEDRRSLKRLNSKGLVYYHEDFYSTTIRLSINAFGWFGITSYLLNQLRSKKMDDINKLTKSLTSLSPVDITSIKALMADFNVDLNQYMKETIETSPEKPAMKAAQKVEMDDEAVIKVISRIHVVMKKNKIKIASLAKRLKAPVDSVQEKLFDMIIAGKINASIDDKDTPGLEDDVLILEDNWNVQQADINRYKELETQIKIAEKRNELTTINEYIDEIMELSIITDEQREHWEEYQLDLEEKIFDQIQSDYDQLIEDIESYPKPVTLNDYQGKANLLERLTENPMIADKERVRRIEELNRLNTQINQRSNAEDLIFSLPSVYDNSTKRDKITELLALPVLTTEERGYWTKELEQIQELLIDDELDELEELISKPKPTAPTPIATGTGEIPQVWSTTDTFPEDFVKDYWDKGYNVTDITYGDGQWSVIMSHLQDYPQRWKTRKEFPADDIKECWDEDYRITDLSYGNGVWALSMTKFAHVPMQRWRTRGALSDVEKEIKTNYDEGYRISDLTYGQDKYGVVFTQPKNDFEQKYIISSNFPQDFINQGWDEAFILSHVVYADSNWIVVMSQVGDDPAQLWRNRTHYPEPEIKEEMANGYTISKLAHGDGVWHLTMTKFNMFTMFYGEESATPAIAPRAPDAPVTSFQLPQVWVTDDNFPKDYVNEYWDKGYNITDIGFGDGKWSIIMSQMEDYPQKWRTRADFPADEIKEGWDEEYRITNLAYGQGLWAVSLTKFAHVPMQRWRTRSSISDIESEISSNFDEGYRISDIAYGQDKWGIVFTQPKVDFEQRYNISSDYPNDFISQGWDDGYSVTQLCHGDGQWIAVLSKLSDPPQLWRTRSYYPEPEIVEERGNGYNINFLVYGESKWALVMTKLNLFTICYEDPTSIEKEEFRSYTKSFKFESPVQMWRTRSTWDDVTPEITQGWDEGKSITHLSYGYGSWSLVMTKVDEAPVQKWFTRSEFPEQEIKDTWAEDYRITNLSWGEDKWALVMTKFKKVPAQRWRTRTEFPSEEITKGWDEGFRISTLTYGNGVWCLIMTKPERNIPQRWRTRTHFPIDEIREGWNDGYIVSSLSYGNGVWALVQSKTDDVPQMWMTRMSYPKPDIGKRWDEDYIITTSYYGELFWAVVMTKHDVFSIYYK